MKNKWFLLSFLMLMLGTAACKSPHPLVSDQDQSPQNKLASLFQQSKPFSDNFTGFMLYDPKTGETIYAQNEKRYFTPASNTKLFTFYTGLKLLPKKIPAMQYVERGDSLIFWGTGDPSFLRTDLHDETVYNFLDNTELDLYYSDAHFRDEGLGPGWAWSDYQYAYSAEKSPFPMYGNMVEFRVKEVTHTALVEDSAGLHISPPYFQDLVKQVSSNTNDTEGEEQPLLFRGFDNNIFHYAKQTETDYFTISKPYHYTPELVVGMLSDTLDKPIEYIEAPVPEDAKMIYSVSADTMYKYMLQPSDNFIAEQLLLAAAAEQGKPLNSQSIIEQMKATHLAGMTDEPQWVDGSGLSRYNLFTPRSMIWLLGQIDREFAMDDKLFELLAIGGEAGTISNWYAPRDGGEPYIFAKTGTLSNNHCLSGYLITKSGRKLYFSFMNNHYVTSSSVVKEEMEKVLWYIHEHY